MSIHLNQIGLLAVLCASVLVCVFLCGLSVILYFNAKRRMKELRRDLDALREKVGILESIKAPEERNTGALNSESLRSRFEQISETKSIPEKYRHIGQLERSGIGAEEMAEILDVSRHEAEQMLALARLSKGEGKDSRETELKSE